MNCLDKERPVRLSKVQVREDGALAYGGVNIQFNKYLNPYIFYKNPNKELV